MSNLEIFKLAKANGCSPFWWKPYNAYCCGCPNGEHMADQQCSIITKESAKKTRKFESFQSQSKLC